MLKRKKGEEDTEESREKREEIKEKVGTKRRLWSRGRREE